MVQRAQLERTVLTEMPVHRERSVQRELLVQLDLSGLPVQREQQVRLERTELTEQLELPEL
ncbi:MAG: hypothetical protein ACR2GJ_06890 [Gemmatimonadaceae bacterium]